MDVKALAKSKRAHSQNHSKRPSNDAAGTAKKQLKEKTHRSSSSALPSNWNRYEELESASHPEAEADLVFPKSKGADFRHLLSESHSHSQPNTTLAFDDVLPGDFNVGLSCMLAVRGEGILSWIGDENFVVEDKTIATHKASFLSLNFHALAENLENIDLSKRLFIEPDLLSPELCAEGSSVAGNEQPDKLHSTEDSELVNRTEELILDDFDYKTADQVTSTSQGSSGTASTFTLSNNILISVNHVDIQFTQLEKSDKNKANLHSAKYTKSENLTFEPATAEEELDMLLDSLGETQNPDSPGFRSIVLFLFHWESLVWITRKQFHPKLHQLLPV